MASKQLRAPALGPFHLPGLVGDQPVRPAPRTPRGPKLGQGVVLAPPCRDFFLLRAMLPPSHARSFFSSRCNARFRGGLVKRQVCVCGPSASWGVWDAEFGVLPSSGRFVRADGSFSVRV